MASATAFWRGRARRGRRLHRGAVRLRKERERGRGEGELDDEVLDASAAGRATLKALVDDPLEGCAGEVARRRGRNADGVVDDVDGALEAEGMEEPHPQRPQSTSRLALP